MKRSVRYGAIVLVVLAASLLAGCGGGQSSQRLRLEITSPSSRTTVTDGVVTVSGIISDPTATVTIDEDELELNAEGAFSRDMDIAYGQNRFVVRAEKEGSSPTTRTITVTRALELVVDSPEKDFVSTSRSVRVNGSVSDPTARVYVTGSEVSVGEDGRFAVDIDLHYPLTIIPVSAVVDGVDPVTEQLSISYDAS